MKKQQTVSICADCGDTQSAFEEIKKQLKKLGLYVYESPTLEGTDMEGVIVSTKKFKNAKEAEMFDLGMDEQEYKEFTS